MAMTTPCQTHDAVYTDIIENRQVGCIVDIPFDLNLSLEQTIILRANMHNVMELVLARYWPTY